MERTVRKKKKDTPQKTSLLRRRINLKDMIKMKMYENLPENAEANFNPDHRVPIKVNEAGVTSGAVGSEDTPKLMIDTSVSSGEDSVFDSSNSPPSPEVFREEQYEELCPFPMEVELTDVHIPVKNSTLLEQSNVQNIATYHQPNVSTILESTILNEDSPQDTCPYRSPSDRCKLVPGSTPDTAIKTPALVKKSLQFLKKRVWFRSPLFSERSRGKISTTPQQIQCDKFIQSEVRPSSPHKDIEPEKLEDDEDDDVEGGVFLDFGSDSELTAYLDSMREGCIRLQSNVLFPSTAMRPKKKKKRPNTVI